MISRKFRPGLPGAFAAASAIIVSGITVVGCLDRPIGLVEPRITATIADPKQQLNPPGESQLGSLDGAKLGLVPALAQMVEGVGQKGCGSTWGSDKPLSDKPRF